MSFIYCPSCGTKNEYISKRPNFCSQCGSSFAIGGRPSPEQNNQKVSEDSIQNCPNLSGLEVEIIKSNPNSVTLGNTLGSGALQGSLKRRPYEVKGESVTKDSIEFCKPSKPKDIDESERRE